MSQTVSDQLDAITATINNNNQQMSTALQTIQTELSGLSPGATVSQEKLDALNAAVNNMTALVTTAQNEANPQPVTPPNTPANPPVTNPPPADQPPANQQPTA